jgi:hypothetical protein
MVRKPKFILTNTSMDDLPEEVQELLENFADIVVDELPSSFPPIRSIDHHIDVIPGTRFAEQRNIQIDTSRE